jgi:hypothetical protein
VVRGVHDEKPIFGPAAIKDDVVHGAAALVRHQGVVAPARLQGRDPVHGRFAQHLNRAWTADLQPGHVADVEEARRSSHRIGFGHDA